jgi:hypothetical protein
MSKIETGIPIPPSRQRCKNQDLYPYADLEIGQSFFAAPRPGKSIRQTAMYLGGMSAYYAKKTGRRFTLRVVEGGVRVWRFA